MPPFSPSVNCDGPEASAPVAQDAANTPVGPRQPWTATGLAPHSAGTHFAETTTSRYLRRSHNACTVPLQRTETDRLLVDKRPLGPDWDPCCRSVRARPGPTASTA